MVHLHLCRMPHRIQDVKALEIQYPESLEAVLNTDAEGFRDEARMALAVKLYELGRLTSGQAAQIAGVSRVAFLLGCPRHGTPTVRWDTEELKAEFGAGAK